VAFDLDRIASYALFARVVQLQSFTAAAKQSGIAKSAVSTRIRDLEERLGVQLLRRTTRKLALTEEGVRFYEHCARVLESASAADSVIAGAGDAVRGPIRVSAPVTFAQMHLGAACAEFLRAHPEVQIELRTDDRMSDVVEGGFDLIVRVGRLDTGSFVARKLATDRLVVCAAPSYLAQRGRPSSPEDVVHHECLHYSLVPMRAEWRFRGAKGPLAIPVAGSFSASDGTVLREAALAGLGLAVLPSFMIARDLEARRLELVLEGHRRAEIGVFAITATRKLPARTRALVDFLGRRFAKPPW
jgi:DNA-binding transcriptional LysR family regulator